MQTYLNLLDNITGELVRRFGAIHSDIAVAVNATHPNFDNVHGNNGH